MSKPRYNIDNVNKNKRLISLMRDKVEDHKANIIDAIVASC